MASIYIPYYDKGWHILKADASKARKVSGYWLYCWVIYGDTAYTTEDGAQYYIDKRYNEAKKYLFVSAT